MLKRRVEQSVLGLLASRRSIRKFRKSPISEEILHLIVETGQSAPCYFQAYSVIWLKSEQLIESAFETCGTEAIKQASAVLLVCVDFNKLETFAETVTSEHFLNLDAYPAEVLLSVLEVGLMVENMVIASEALGYGTLLLDCGIYECERFTELLKLPNGVIPLTILLIGEKDENPPPRPRWPLETVLHVDGYRPITSKDAEKYLETAEKLLAREGYLLKYANFKGSYSEYLAERFNANKELRQSYNALSSFIRKHGVKV
ncbi:MAG: nitroreductase family protein [Candidatus Caldarchaeum sp.]|nr:nitroreductase family protein [Candidatus Caldarchaeum sp.]MDW8434693.1 nitroreductase family protein [Candidatus Caldarchaeum sp.]